MGAAQTQPVEGTDGTTYPNNAARALGTWPRKAATRGKRIFGLKMTESKTPFKAIQRRNHPPS